VPRSKKQSRATLLSLRAFVAYKKGRNLPIDKKIVLEIGLELSLLNIFTRYLVNIYINTLMEGSDITTGRGQALGSNRTFIPDIYLLIQNVPPSTKVTIHSPCLKP
jgi:hypothetical protein